ncbi:MAG: PEP-CTERM/exosortase system-associated acyltransferase [Gammaproteobacteria bacterium]|nr:PEP-CTERM/exosortase system-associated acyltransferase [Gammaproteobacteria bacterium]MDH5593055.1 PEP-CTERM/exosortase system-associated acyltransferase [Gammaproteobacteria bacterium]
MPSLKKLFHEYFDVQEAGNQALIEESFKIRYQVYCLENSFENPEHFPDEMEIDRYDARSVHSVIKHRRTEMVAATVRLVLPNQENLFDLFPIEEFCPEAITNIDNILKTIPRNEIAEISRFAVSKDFKKRLNEQGTIAGVSPDTESYPDPENAKNDKKASRLFPHISLGLFQGIVRMTADNNIKYWYAVMEPSLLRLLTRFGIQFKAIGPVTNYHGMRQPCFAVANEVMSGIYHQRKDVWELITDDGTTWPAPEKQKVSKIAG